MFSVGGEKVHWDEWVKIIGFQFTFESIGVISAFWLQTQIPDWKCLKNGKVG